MVEIEAVLFDIDGTLVDSNEQHVNAWAFAFREEGHPQELDDIRSQIGKGGDLLVPELLPDMEETARKRISKRLAITSRTCISTTSMPLTAPRI